MTKDDFNLNNLFTVTGRDVWKIVSYCETPTVEMKNLETTETMRFGMGGVTAEKVTKIFDYPSSSFGKEVK